MVIARHQVAQIDPDTVARLLAEVKALAGDDGTPCVADEVPEA